MAGTPPPVSELCRVERVRTSAVSFSPVRVVRCAYCGRPIKVNSGQRALLPALSMVGAPDPNGDDRRSVLACGPEHLDELISQALSIVD